MKTEKNIILCSIFALTIGIATVVPLAFFMDTASAQTDESWLDINVPWAYFSADATDSMYKITGGIAFTASPNYDLLGQHIDARVDYVELTICTDDLQLSKSHYYFGTYRPNLETPPPMKTAESDEWFKVPWFNEMLGIAPYGMSSREYVNAIPNTGMYLYNATELPPEDYPDVSPDARETMGQAGQHIGNIDETTNAILAALENTQTIYLDIRRVAYITFDDNGTVTTSECDQFIQRIELTKNSNGEFVFGDLAGIEKCISGFDLLEVSKQNYASGIPTIGFGAYSSWG